MWGRQVQACSILHSPGSRSAQRWHCHHALSTLQDGPQRDEMPSTMARPIAGTCSRLAEHLPPAAAQFLEHAAKGSTPPPGLQEMFDRQQLSTVCIPARCHSPSHNLWWASPPLGLDVLQHGHPLWEWAPHSAGVPSCCETPEAHWRARQVQAAVAELPGQVTTPGYRWPLQPGRERQAGVLRCMQTSHPQLCHIILRCPGGAPG